MCLNRDCRSLFVSRGAVTEGGGPSPLDYMFSVHSNSKNYKIVKISLIKLNRAAALAGWEYAGKFNTGERRNQVKFSNTSQKSGCAEFNFEF